MAEYYVLRGSENSIRKTDFTCCLPFCIRFAFRQGVENWGTSCKFQLRMHGSIGTFCNMNIPYISPRAGSACLLLLQNVAEMPRTFEPSKRTGRVPYHITLSSTRLKDELVFLFRGPWLLWGAIYLLSISFNQSLSPTLTTDLSVFSRRAASATIPKA